MKILKWLMKTAFEEHEASINATGCETGNQLAEIGR